MIQIKRTRKRNYQDPVSKYLPMAAAGVFILLLVLTIVGFSGRGRLAARMDESREMMAASVQSDINRAMNSYAAVNRKNADLSGDVLPSMKMYMFAAYDMNRVLAETFGEEYSMIDTAQYDEFQEVMAEFDKLLSTGQSAGPAKERLAACMEGIQTTLGNRFNAEGGLLPQTAMK